MVWLREPEGSESKVEVVREMDAYDMADHQKWAVEQAKVLREWARSVR